MARDANREITKAIGGKNIHDYLKQQAANRRALAERAWDAGFHRGCHAPPNSKARRDKERRALDIDALLEAPDA